MNNIIKAKTFAKAYEKALRLVYENPDFESSPRYQKIRECLNVTLQIEDPTSNLFTNGHRSLPLKYLKNELILYLTGRNDAAGFIKASKFWEKLANKDGTINSAYGYLIWNCFNVKSTLGKTTQFGWAFDSLCNDKDSRQAIMHYNKIGHQRLHVKDFPCTMNNIFIIRDDKLHMTTLMRSNDLFFGTTFDVPFFTLVQWLMYIKLVKFYPELKMGTYTHIANSLHIYERDFQTVEKMLESEFIPGSMPLPQVDDIIKNPMIMDMSYGRVFETSTLDFIASTNRYHQPDNIKFLKWLNDR